MARWKGPQVVSMENSEVPTMHGKAFLISQPQELNLFCRLLVFNLAFKNTGTQTYARIRLEVLRWQGRQQYI